MNEQPTIELWHEDGEDSGRVVSGITWPNGHYSEWEVGYELDDTLEVGFSLGSIFKAAGKLVGKVVKPVAKILKPVTNIAKVVFPLSGPAVTKIAAPATANLIVPGSGKAVSSALRGVEQGASSKKKAATTKQRASGAAQARLISDVSRTLKSPATMAALERVGVSRKQTAKAGALFDGVRNAALAMVYKQRGQIDKALEHGRRAEGLAKAASVSPASVKSGAQKLYYLTLSPGGR